MPSWYVEYRNPDGTTAGMVVPFSAGKTAAEVHKAVEAGNVPELFVPKGGVSAVRKLDRD
jgi:hypothetical protein